MPTSLFQEGVSGPANSANVDALISSANATTNYGTDTSFIVGVFTVGQLFRQRMVLEFDIDSIPDAAVIHTATLRLFSEGTFSGTGFTVSAKRLTTAFVENTVTWIFPWTTSGGDFTATNQGTAAPDDGEDWVIGGLATLAQDAKDSRNGKLRLLVRVDADSGNNFTQLYSSDHTTAEERPLLTVSWDYPVDGEMEYTSPEDPPHWVSEVEPVQWRSGIEPVQWSSEVEPPHWRSDTEPPEWS